MDGRTPRQLLPEFYKQYDFGIDGGQSNNAVRVELTNKIILYFPNFKARKEGSS